ncbi:hypothetical protein JXB37_01700 [candidate division WOR-3 bacterium]|nr:hypothetical protein [candidate division WOR-3 bacterium]
MSGLALATLMLLGQATFAPGVPTLQLGPKPGFEPTLPAPSDWVDGDETLHWDADPDRGFNISGTYSYGCAQRYTETTGVTIKAILYYLTGNADDILVYAAGESTSATPGPMLDSTRANGQGGGVWKRANLPHPPSIQADEDFWACVIVRRHPSGEHPLTLDLGPIVAWRGGYITLPSIGPDWYQLTDPPFWTDRNVNIRAVIERAGTGIEEVIGPAVSNPLPATIVRGVLYLGVDSKQNTECGADLLDAGGRRVMDLVPGPNDISALSPGIYFVRHSESRPRRVVVGR